MAPKKPKVDTSAQEESLRLQRERLEKERLEAQTEKERIATETTGEFLARRRGQRGRQSLIATSETGEGTRGGVEGLKRRKALRGRPMLGGPVRSEEDKLGSTYRKPSRGPSVSPKEVARKLLR